MKEKRNEDDRRKEYTAGHKRGNNKKQLTCHWCKRLGHFKWYCRKFAAAQQRMLWGAREVKALNEQCCSKGASFEFNQWWRSYGGRSCSFGCFQKKWIIDSRATCHMCNDKNLFRELHHLSRSQEVTLGDGRVFGSHNWRNSNTWDALTGRKYSEMQSENVLYVSKFSTTCLVCWKHQKQQSLQSSTTWTVKLWMNTTKLPLLPPE